MRSRGFQIFSATLSWALALLAVVQCVLTWGASPPWPPSSLLLGALLTTAAVVAAHLAASAGERPVPRLAAVFVFAALAVLPAPGGLAVALVAAAAARGAFAGPHVSGIRGYAGAALAFSLAQLVVSAAPPAFDGLAGLAGLLLLLPLVQAVATLAVHLLSGAADADGLPRGAYSWKAVGVELVVAPLAWLLVGMLRSEEWIQAALLGAAVIAAQLPLLRLVDSESRLRRVEGALSARKTELNILHAVGREIMSSFDLDRVCRTVDRECCKIFEVDFLFVALAADDGDGLEVIYRRRDGFPAERAPSTVGRKLARWMAEEKRALRIDDTATLGGVESVELEPTEPAVRAAMLAPMIIEDRVIGLLSVQSNRVGAYDDHQLTVLTTVAQQAAVAIESVRHYRKATIDSLTGFFLRDYFFRRLQDEHRRVSRYGGEFSLLMVDLDGFKTINDEHGHLAGDQYLRAVGTTIRSRLRAADIACRYGGDEFCLLLPQTGHAGAGAIAERIRSAIAGTTVEVEGVPLRSTVSIGLASFAGAASGGIDVEEVLQQADQALYRAKRAGRDCVMPFAGRPDFPAAC